MNRSIIVVPTYNEKENIAALIKSILSHMPKSTVLIVDDNSPDGTADIVKKLTKDIRIKLIVRKKKKGRGSAVLEGFKWAYKRGNFDYFFELDADFSHDPADLPKFLAKLKAGHDVVIGSRYMPDSQIHNWGAARKFFSKYANKYAKFFLKIPIIDFTNGYRAYKKDTVTFFLFRKMITSGYIVLSEFIYIAHLNGKKIGKLPIVFVNRKRGESNLGLKEILTAMYGVMKLRVKRNELINEGRRLINN